MSFFFTLSFILLCVVLFLLSRLSKLKKELNLRTENVERLNKEKDVVLNFLDKAGDTFTEKENLPSDDLYRVALDSACDSLKAAGAAIFYYEGENQVLTTRMIRGFFPPFFETGDVAVGKAASKSKFLNSMVEKHRVRMGEDVVGAIAQKREPLLIVDGLADYRIPKATDPFMQIRSFAGVPLIMGSELLGVMAVVNKKHDESFSKTDLSILESLADQVALSLNTASLRETQRQKEKLDRELEIAKEIQQLLFPTKRPTIERFDIAYMTQAAKEVGGDYFDFIPIDENRIGIVVADVSGKGVPGALIMTMVRSIMRSIAPGHLSSRSVICELNKQISKDLKPDMFITMLYMILDKHNQILTLVRAGHDPLIHYHAEQKKIEFVKGKGMAIGIVEGPEFEGTLEERVIKLNPNDVVGVYTDGATEARDRTGKDFGREGLCDAIRVSAASSSQLIVQNIRQRIYRHTGGSPQEDDLTLLVLKALP